VAGAVGRIIAGGDRTCPTTRERFCPRIVCQTIPINRRGTKSDSRPMIRLLIDFWLARDEHAVQKVGLGFVRDEKQLAAKECRQKRLTFHQSTPPEETQIQVAIESCRVRQRSVSDRSGTGARSQHMRHRFSRNSDWQTEYWKVAARDDRQMTTAVDANVVLAFWDKAATLSLAAQNALDA
jgi:hypothetical protein